VASTPFITRHSGRNLRNYPPLLVGKRGCCTGSHKNDLVLANARSSVVLLGAVSIWGNGVPGSAAATAEGQMTTSLSEFYKQRSLYPMSLSITTRIGIIAFAYLLLSVMGVRADSTYCYQGNDFTSAVGGYTTSDAETGCVTLTSALPANSSLTVYNSDVATYSFSDGVQTIGGGPPPAALGDTFAFETDDGVITEWDIYVTAAEGVAVISTVGNDPDFSPPSEDEAFGISGDAQAHNENDPGVWSAAEPSSFVLLFLGLIAVGMVARRTRHPKQAAPTTTFQPH
jgi:hypothetical protein